MPREKKDRVVVGNKHYDMLFTVHDYDVWYLCPFLFLQLHDIKNFHWVFIVG